MSASAPMSDIFEEAPKMTGPGFLFREMQKRGIRIYSDTYPKFSWKIQGNFVTDDGLLWTDEWEQQAGSLVDVIKESTWLFEWGALGKVTGHDWLECNKCGMVQLKSKKDGAPSALKGCILTVGCKGKMKRFDEGIFEIVIPGKRRRSSGTVRSGVGSTKKGIPMEVRKEALAMYDKNNNLSETARQMNVKHPEYSISAAGVTYWRNQRKTNPEVYA